MCAKALLYCDKRTGLDLDFWLYDPFEALSVFCGDDPPKDACDAPQHCVPGAVQCVAEDLRHALTLTDGLTGLRLDKDPVSRQPWSLLTFTCMPTLEELAIRAHRQC